MEMRPFCFFEKRLQRKGSGKKLQVAHLDKGEEKVRGQLCVNSGHCSVGGNSSGANWGESHRVLDGHGAAACRQNSLGDTPRKHD